MSYAYEQYIGSGIAGPYSVPFPFLSRAHVKVYLDDVETTDFTWSTGSTILFDSVVPADVVITITRATSPETIIEDFNDGSVLAEANLDASALQMFYLAQEALDTTERGLRRPLTGTEWDGEERRLTNIADAVADTDAMNMRSANAAIAATAASETAAAASEAAAAASEAAAASSATSAAASATAADASEAAADASEAAAAASAASAAASATAAGTSEANAASSASAAATSATNAAASATAADTSEANAASSASAAASSASAAAASATAADTSEANAASSASAAATSATNASNSATSAASSASTATTQATNASNSATAAATSATNAANSATAAAGSATTATTQASNASSSASAASTSATNASNSASAASTSATNAASSATAASSSASAASTSATNAANSATAAATSATNAANSATAAATSAAKIPDPTAPDALKGIRVNAGGTAYEFYVAGGGDVNGPASAVDGQLAAFDGTTGKLIADSGHTPASIAALVDTSGKMDKSANLSDLANAATARTNLNVPTRTGGDASGTWGISISGNAATATTAAACSGNAATATTAASCSGNAATVTTITTTQVLNATAGLTAGGVGTYILAAYTGGSLSFNATTAGSNLTPTNATNSDSAAARAGTWRCLGQVSGGAGNNTTLWVRIS